MLPCRVVHAPWALSLRAPTLSRVRSCTLPCALGAGRTLCRAHWASALRTVAARVGTVVRPPRPCRACLACRVRSLSRQEYPTHGKNFVATQKCCSDPRTRPDPIGESESKPWGRPFDSFYLHFYYVFFFKSVAT